jgi:hypothetical protein
MKRLQLDYSPYTNNLRKVLGGVTLAACFLVGFWLLAEQRHLNEKISHYEAQAGLSAVSQTARATITSAERQAGEATYALNMPWESMLEALEQVQAANPGVHLLAVQPNPNKGEVQLGGEADDFSALMSYKKALRTKPQFVEVVLVNQRLANENSPTKLAFTLLADWEIK